jgi:hypothetical protein
MPYRTVQQSRMHGGLATQPCRQRDKPNRIRRLHKERPIPVLEEKGPLSRKLCILVRGHNGVYTGSAMQHRDLGDVPAQLNLGLAQEIVAEARSENLNFPVAERFPVFVPSGLFDGGHVLDASIGRGHDVVVALWCCAKVRRPRKSWLGSLRGGRRI